MPAEPSNPSTHPAGPIELSAGPLALTFCPDSGLIRHIRLAGIEVIRGIYAAVRDRNWGTAPMRLAGLRIDRREDAFDIAFTAICRENDIHFEWNGRVRGSSDGTIEYTFDGRAVTDFERNRIGFCVLHPIRECAGRPCVVELTQGGEQSGCFPDQISAHQPFKTIRSIRHEAAPGLWARVVFEGDVFEMEDQRNWSDASYKTYCTPLERPFPVRIAAGTRIQQRVTLRLEGRAPSAAGVRASRVDDEPIRLQVGLPVMLPRLGLCAAGDAAPLSGREQERLRALRLDHLRVDVRFDQPAWNERLLLAAREAGGLGAGLHVALHLGEDARRELDGLRTILGRLAAPISAWLVFHRDQKCTSADWLNHVAPLLRELRPQAAVVSGTNIYLAELNRGRPPVPPADRICFSINPQVHAFDDISLVETLDAQVHMLRSARRLAENAPIAVTPITLRPRFNPNATGAAATPAPGELPKSVDPRQCSLFAAGWTLGSIAAMAAGGAESVTYYETTGWCGVMERESGAPLPARFPSIPGGVFPVYHVLADLADCRDRSARLLECENPLTVQALMLEGGRRACLVANLSDRPQRIALPEDSDDGKWYIRVLDEPALPGALTEPDQHRLTAVHPCAAPIIELKPHAYARVERRD